MDEKSLVDKLAVFAVRVLGFVFLIMGLWQLVVRAAEFIAEFNPVYLKVILLGRAVEPITAIVIGFFLFLFCRPLGQLLARVVHKD
ncbi:MAG: hypothetical protein AAF984_09965 [Verrucomicrobiota bacterium]